MRDIHPVRGFLWILIAMILGSIKAECVINGSMNFDSSSISRTYSIPFDTSPVWKDLMQEGICSYSSPSESIAKASFSHYEDQGRKKIESPQYRIITGSIEDNLYNSGTRAGLPPSLILDLTDIFSSHIDFTTDLRKGDTFSVLLGKPDQNLKLTKWKILAARITVQGETYEAFFFQPHGGKGAYYDAGGKSTTGTFLKAPLQYRRISSFFTRKRFHPILKIYRPHFGIDYAAPAGTPVSAIGPGKVVFAGRKGGFGNYIEIRHNNIYSSSYGHLSKFARGIRAGKDIERGEVIGYVGKTGLATGPHLDFRFYASGRPVNFSSLSRSHFVEAVPRNSEKKFQTAVERYRTLLNQKEANKIAGMPFPE